MKPQHLIQTLLRNQQIHFYYYKIIEQQVFCFESFIYALSFLSYWYDYKTYTTILEEELNVLIMQKSFLLDKINNMDIVNIRLNLYFTVIKKTLNLTNKFIYVL